VLELVVVVVVPSYDDDSVVMPLLIVVVLVLIALVDEDSIGVLLPTVVVIDKSVESLCFSNNKGVCLIFENRINVFVGGSFDSTHTCRFESIR
jgi:hypothetical protein